VGAKGREVGWGLLVGFGEEDVGWFDLSGWGGGVGRKDCWRDKS